jgi:glycosyltransferase involved in cell wall biosynthesis
MKINILLITTVSNIGGTENMLLSFLSNFDRLKFNVIVASLFGANQLGTEVEKKNIQFKNLDLNRFWSFPFRLRKIIRQNHIDLIQTFGLTAEIAVNPIAKSFGVKKLIASIRSAHTDRKWYHNLLSRFANRKVDLWISNSMAGKNTTINNLKINPQKIKVIWNGLDISKYADNYMEIADQLKRKLKLENKFVILTVANLRPEKRHCDILAAINLIDKQIRENLIFIFSGRDSLSGEVQRKINENGFSENIILTGFQSEVAPYYLLADIFLLASDREGLPVSIMEAMYFGKSIISTNVGGVSELINHEKEGLLLEPRHPEQIADNIVHLYNDKQLRVELGRKARERILKEFKLQHMVTEIEQTFLDLLVDKNSYSKKEV